MGPIWRGRGRKRGERGALAGGPPPKGRETSVGFRSTGVLGKPVKGSV